MFVVRVKEKEAELKDSEKEVSLWPELLNSKITFISSIQLHAKFEKLKKDHAEDKRKLEESRKKLEDEFVVSSCPFGSHSKAYPFFFQEFNRRKSQLASSHTLTLGKNKKK